MLHVGFLLYAPFDVHIVFFSLIYQNTPRATVHKQVSLKVHPSSWLAHFGHVHQNRGFDWFKTTATSINAKLTVHSAEEFAVKEDLLSYVTILPEKVNKNKQRTKDYNQTHWTNFTVSCR